MDRERVVLVAVGTEFERYKKIAERTIEQLDAEQLVARPTEESLSVAMLVWHISGNLTSRFTDFLTTDGEKAWRNRDSEFEVRDVGRDELLEKWEAGWRVVASELERLSDDDLARPAVIRGYTLTVADALQRSLAHTSYHVGQIAYLGKWLRGDDWTYLSIPPGVAIPFNPDA